MNKLLGTLLLLMTTFWVRSQAPENDALLYQAGSIHLDLAADGCDDADLPAPVRINFSDGVSQQFCFADQLNANYAFLEGSYHVAPQLEIPEYFNVTPASADIVLGGANNHAANFCLTPNGIHRDAEVIILPASQPAPGQPGIYRVIVRNKGNQILSGSINVTYPADRADYLSASPAPHGRTANVLHWSFGNLNPFESRTYSLNLQTHQAAGAQAVNVGDELSLSANVTLAEPDDTPADNQYDLKVTASSSLDPNNKICLEGSVAPPSMIGQYLNYIINFQNTGTTTIQKVVINDQIDTNQFEFSSVQVISLSHPGTAFPLSNKVEAYFQDINLAPGQSGYVAFKIKTKATLPVNSTVSNKAKIYFDFNFPIETNSVHTTFQVLGSDEHRFAEATLFPNPAGNLVTIEANQEIVSVSVTDAQGRRIAQLPVSATAFIHDVSGYTSGVYYLRIETANGTLTRKLVKQ